IAHLPQRTEQPTGHEHHREQQHALIEPASHAAWQAGGDQRVGGSAARGFVRHRGYGFQFCGASVDAGTCWGSKVLWSTWPGAEAIRGVLVSGLGFAFGTVASLSGATGFRAGAVLGGLAAP